jgi:exonuclease SbcC
MKLRSFEFKNFGKHKRVAQDINANVVGFRGGNYSGKTTVLRGIRYCITGELSDRQEKAASYIRNWDPKSKAELSVVVDSPTGQQIAITRVIGNSSTERILQIGNEPGITKAKEFDAAMSSIFGTDISAISKLAFSPQGALASLLNTLSSEREKLFMRVLDADHILAAAKTFANKSSLLRGTTVDYKPLIADTRVLYQQTREKLYETEGELTVLNKEDNPITMAGVYRALQEEVRAVTELDSRIRGLNSELANLRSRKASLSQVDEVQISLIAEDRDKLVQSLTCIRLADRRAELVNELAAEEKVLQEFDQNDCGAQLLELKAGNPLMEKIRHNYSLRSSDSDMLEIQVPKGSLDEYLGELEIEIRDEQNILEKLETDLENLARAVYMLTESKAIRSKKWDDSGDCPLCGTCSPPKPWEASDQRALDEVSKSVAETSTCIRDKKQYITELQRSQSRIQLKIAQIRRFFKDDEEIVPAILGGKLTALSYLEYRALHDPLDSEVYRVTAGRESAQRKVDYLRQSLKDIPEMTAEGSREDYERRLSEVDTQLKQLQDTKNLHTRLDGSIAQAYEQEQLLRLELGKRSKKLDAGLTAARVTYDSLADVAKRNEEHRDALISALERKEMLMGELQKNLQAIERYMKLDKGQVAKVTFLNHLQDAAQRMERIPKVFVRRQFDSLVEVVSSILVEMDTLYEVKPDPEVPLSFIYRDFVDDSVWLPQSKLSGSQSVRLSLAFLIAVQRALLPHIGFMALDEPSLHLDPNGKKQLSELFQKLGTTIFTGNTQLLLFDYDDRVLTYCDQIVDLGS